MKYRDFVAQFVGQKGYLQWTDGPHMNFQVGDRTPSSNLVEVGDDYIIFDNEYTGKSAYPLSIVSINFK